jgi:hypothetical protein
LSCCWPDSFSVRLSGWYAVLVILKFFPIARSVLRLSVFAGRRYKL